MIARKEDKITSKRDCLITGQTHQYYYMHMKATILREYIPFQIVEIQVQDFEKPLLVDICTLTTEPDYSSTISLRILGEG